MALQSELWSLTQEVRQDRIDSLYKSIRDGCVTQAQTGECFDLVHFPTESCRQVVFDHLMEEGLTLFRLDLITCQCIPKQDICPNHAKDVLLVTWDPNFDSDTFEEIMRAHYTWIAISLKDN